MNLSFIFTNYNNSGYTLECVKSITDNIKYECVSIIIVDNNSNQEDRDVLTRLKDQNKSVTVLFNEENIGYFPGLNVGIKHLLKSDFKFNYIIIGNNDLIFPAHFYNEMLSSQVTLNKYPVVAPNLITIDGVHQNPHAIAKISKRRQFIYDLYHINYYLSLLISFTAKVTRKFTQRRDHEEHKEGQIIHQGYGACYILTPVFFQHFDALKSPSFLMHEELFLSIQLEKSGLNMYYEPAISIIHYDHATVSKVATKKFWKISADAYWEFKKILNQNLIALK